MISRLAALRFLALACLALFVAPAVQAQDKPVLVFAAASLKDALDGVATAWQAQGGQKPAISYAASSALAKQIESGAPADVFISADLDWMDYLAGKKLIDDRTRRNLLGNRIVLVAPAASTARLAIAPGFDLAGALQGGRLAMADVAAVPAGKYGKAALEQLGVWAKVQDRVAQSENVRAALALVSRGEAPLGIVYETDAAADKGVRVVDRFPENSHPPIIYPAAVTAASTNAQAAPFVAFLRGDKARGIFAEWGFTTLN